MSSSTPSPCPPILTGLMQITGKITRADTLTNDDIYYPANKPMTMFGWANFYQQSGRFIKMDLYTVDNTANDPNGCSPEVKQQGTCIWNKVYGPNMTFRGWTLQTFYDGSSIRIGFGHLLPTCIRNNRVIEAEWTEIGDFSTFPVKDATYAKFTQIQQLPEAVKTKLGTLESVQCECPPRFTSNAPPLCLNPAYPPNLKGFFTCTGYYGAADGASLCEAKTVDLSYNFYQQNGLLLNYLQKEDTSSFTYYSAVWKKLYGSGQCFAGWQALMSTGTNNEIITPTRVVNNSVLAFEAVFDTSIYQFIRVASLQSTDYPTTTSTPGTPGPQSSSSCCSNRAAWAHNRKYLSQVPRAPSMSASKANTPPIIDGPFSVCLSTTGKNVPDLLDPEKFYWYSATCPLQSFGYWNFKNSTDRLVNLDQYLMQQDGQCTMIKRCLDSCVWRNNNGVWLLDISSVNMVMFEVKYFTLTPTCVVANRVETFDFVSSASDDNNVSTGNGIRVRALPTAFKDKFSGVTTLFCKSNTTKIQGKGGDCRSVFD